MSWKFKNNFPIYTQLVDAIKAKIFTGEYLSGERLPSVRELATTAGVNPNTMQRAMSELENIGLVYSNRTLGRYITEDTELINSQKFVIAKERLDDFINIMNNLGLSKDEISQMVDEKIKGES